MNYAWPMDTITEQIVERKKSTVDYITMVLISLGFLLVFVFLFVLARRYAVLFNILFFVVFGIGYLLWKLLMSFNVEYEYSVINGEIDIDKIISKRKRKRIVSFSAKNIETFKKYTGNNGQKNFRKVIFAGSDPKSPNLWCCAFKDRAFGNTLLIFEPNEKVLQAIKPYLPRLVASDAFGWN